MAPSATQDNASMLWGSDACIPMGGVSTGSLTMIPPGDSGVSTTTISATH